MKAHKLKLEPLPVNPDELGEKLGSIPKRLWDAMTESQRVAAVAAMGAEAAARRDQQSFPE